MFNIMICELSSGRGGTAEYLYSFLRHLDRGVFYPIVVFSHNVGGPVVQKIRDLGIEIVFLRDEEKGPLNIDLSGYPLLWRKVVAVYRRSVLLYRNCAAMGCLISLIRKRKVRLLLSNQEVIYNPPAILAAALSRIPCIVRKAGIAIYRGEYLMRVLSFFPSVLVASSNAEYQNHIDRGFPFKKMVTIWEGVDVAEFSPSSDGDEVRRELGIPSGTLVVGSISRIDEGKGHEDLLQAAGVVLKEIPDTVFLIVGDGDKSMKAELKGLARALGIEDRVIFAGWRNDIARILPVLDVFVHCPNDWLEGMGIATLEAIASGKPVVITKNWGLADTTVDGYNGFIVPVRDCRGLAEKIIVLLRNAELRAAMGKNSRARAVLEFDIRKNVRAIEKLMLDELNASISVNLTVSSTR